MQKTMVGLVMKCHSKVGETVESLRRVRVSGPAEKGGRGVMVAVHAYVLVTDIAERRQLDMQGERGDFPCPVCYSKHTSGYLS